MRVVLFGIVGILVAFIAGYYACYSIQVRPFAAHLEAREASLRQWDDLIRSERQRISKMEDLKDEQRKTYFRKAEEASIEFVRLLDGIHKLELRLVSPPTLPMMLTAILVIVSILAVVWLSTDANRDAATTIRNVASSEPTLIVRTCVALAPNSLPFVDAESAGSRLSTSHTTRIIDSTVTKLGTIKKFYADKRMGFIIPDDGTPDIYFPMAAVKRREQFRIREGATVRCLVEQGAKGPRATEVEFV